ncbi:hypothetical protein MAQ5080_00875 [Marinomonas aquimarina]|uniref:DUF2255 family protein n=1 Tax=Marinomonas aquimarina TaxID=295068 RepID=A0A1A8T5J8_9GAMM|nr:DUF2255 family protein [Marinomonas aquimarina]SBS27637.1 hypothetical protein MAQ5080_00875 [Marinomonas aquimarina]
MWNPDVLHDILKEDDLHIAPYKQDGCSTGTPTWIWCVEVAGELYVRAYHGKRSRWYQAALAQQIGRIFAIGKCFEVRYEAIDDDMTLAAVDHAYSNRYSTSSYLDAMINARARATTLKVILRGQ